MSDLWEGLSFETGGGRRYEIMSVVGRGGFGTVYRARLWGASGFTKSVAIKVLQTRAAASLELQQRLRDEARLLGMLRHRAIVRVDELLCIGDRWALVMEFIDGADLRELVLDRPLPLRPVCEIAIEVAAALAVAHRAVDPETGESLQIVHRDIKPANIRLTCAGEVKVLDFGVARARFARREAFTGEVALGSMAYLAPERANGVDTPAADIYALGATLFESLVGQALGPPSLDPMRHQLKLRTNLETLNELVPGQAGQLVVKLLESMMLFDHRKRPTAAQVVDAFREILILADGPWLNRWATGAVGRVHSLRPNNSSGERPAITGPRRSTFSTTNVLVNSSETLSIAQPAPDRPEQHSSGARTTSSPPRLPRTQKRLSRVFLNRSDLLLAAITFAITLALFLSFLS